MLEKNKRKSKSIAIHIKNSGAAEYTAEEIMIAKVAKFNLAINRDLDKISHINKLLAELKEDKFYEAFYSYYIDHKKASEIACRMNVSEITIKRGIKKLFQRYCVKKYGANVL